MVPDASWTTPTKPSSNRAISSGSSVCSNTALDRDYNAGGAVGP
jgi:hypothetical protein